MNMDLSPEQVEVQIDAVLHSGRADGDELNCGVPPVVAQPRPSFENPLMLQHDSCFNEYSAAVAGHEDDSPQAWRVMEEFNAAELSVAHNSRECWETNRGRAPPVLSVLSKGDETWRVMEEFNVAELSIIHSSGECWKTRRDHTAPVLSEFNMDMHSALREAATSPRPTHGDSITDDTGIMCACTGEEFDPCLDQSPASAKSHATLREFRPLPGFTMQDPWLFPSTQDHPMPTRPLQLGARIVAHGQPAEVFTTDPEVTEVDLELGPSLLDCLPEPAMDWQTSDEFHLDELWYLQAVDQLHSSGGAIPPDIGESGAFLKDLQTAREVWTLGSSLAG